MKPELKIYFAGAIRGGRDDAHIYAEIISFLNGFGEVLTEHVGDQSLTEAGDDGPDDRYIHDRDMVWLNQSDIVIAEVTNPSLGVGYELGSAVNMGKPILCLYRMDARQRLSAMISGSPDMKVAEYKSINEAEELIKVFINSVTSGLGKDRNK
ncbi:MAG: nucleoside 2-deoxyribosyltransferase [Deltaproteobacteria bacterium]|nr:nucleoside 2-deoxyribosyltransferase [Deltaproteobacteria bacterium]